MVPYPSAIKHNPFLLLSKEIQIENAMSFIAPNDMQPYHGFAVAWI
jgi:hypothetical protein